MELKATERSEIRNPENTRFLDEARFMGFFVVQQLAPGLK